jgi:primosomal protein N'
LRELWKGGEEVPEPAPAPIARVEGKFRYQIFLLVKRVAPVMRDLKREVLLQKWPVGMKVSVDVDAQDLL